MPTVLITPTQFREPDADYFAPLREGGFDMRFPPNQEFVANPDAMIQLLKGVDCVVASTEPYSAEIFRQSNLKAIARTGVGFDSVDVPAATANGVVVTITPGAVDGSVAEHTLALMLAVYRDIRGRDAEVRGGEWTRQGGPRLAGQTLGIVGLGRIGRAVAVMAQALSLNVIAHDPFPAEEFAADRGIRLCTLDELLTEADIVSLHLPCTPDSEKLINQRTLALMKPDATLINTGRGGLVDEDALFTAMSSGHLRGAGLDVFQQEPLPIDSPLLSLPNVVATTHTAGLDYQSEYDMPRIAAECLAELFAGGWPENCVVNRDVKGTWSL